MINNSFLLTISSFTPPFWLVIPFISLLLLIAIGPLFFAKFWHHQYKKIAVAIGVGVALFYLIVYKQPIIVAETFAEYVSFISLLLALYVASGGIYVFADFESKAKVNILFLFAGAILANFIGTTGASVLLIRPFMRINRYRLQPYHVVFFIFFVSNLGGLLTPIGDPPLFMGFLKGIPFFWPTAHLFLPWIIALLLLSIVFYFLEKRNTKLDEVDVSEHYTNKIIITGKHNFIWLALIIASVFIDPNVLEGVPYIELHGKKISFIREFIQIAIAFIAYKGANKNALKSNEFDFEPIKEVGFLFVGIFMSMIPALQLLEYAGSHVSEPLSHGLIYWGAGVFSSVLDNAPTYVNFLALSLSMFGFSVSDLQQIHTFLSSDNRIYIEALSVGSVFFGAMTYIGNGPNFMVKAIAEQQGVKMPGFFAYIVKYTLPFLLPVLAIIWLLFFSSLF
ncbi:MAG: sodium:proton antiporter [Bacteroidia bacterium]|nr:sodium:proton antiporter [Bacteroidia bacterium]